MPFFPPFQYLSANTFSQCSALYLHHGTQLWEVKYQPGKVTRISYLPHDCLSNCSSFSHLQGLKGAGGERAGVRQTGTPPPRPYNPQCLSRLLIHVCVEHTVSLHTSPSPSPSMSSPGLCVLHVSSYVSPGMRRIKLLPYMTLLRLSLTDQRDQALICFSKWYIYSLCVRGFGSTKFMPF